MKTKSFASAKKTKMGVKKKMNKKLFCDFCKRTKVKKSFWGVNNICEKCYCENSIDFRNMMFLPIMYISIVFFVISFFLWIIELNNVFEQTFKIAMATGISIPAF